MTTPRPIIIKTITELEIRDVLHYCHWIAARQGLQSAVMHLFPEYTVASLLATLRAARALKRSDNFAGYEPRKNLSHVNFLSDGTCQAVKKAT